MANRPVVIVCEVISINSSTSIQTSSRGESGENSLVSDTVQGEGRENTPDVTVDRHEITRQDSFLQDRPPGVEWIYPTLSLSPQSSVHGENEENSTVSDNGQQEGDNGLVLGQVRDNEFEEASVTIVIDPRVTMIDPRDDDSVLVIEGVIESDERSCCIFALCGVQICNNSSPIKRKYQVLAFGITLAVAVSSIIFAFWQIGVLQPGVRREHDLVRRGKYHFPSLQPSMQPSLQHSPPPSFSSGPSLQQRTINITNAIFDVSGRDVLMHSSPQNKALNWIIYEDEGNLSYNDSNLIQRYALMVIYFSLSGKSWSNNEGYDSEKNECFWSGVTCTQIVGQRHGEVVEFHLSKNRLSGTVPQEIGVLDRLSKLKIEHNNIKGSIPTTLFQLQRLTELDISTCMLTGTIPSNIGNLKMLTVLKLFGNNLSGSIPSTIGRLGSLKQLELNRNSFVENIPETITNCKSLAVFNLGVNLLSGSIPVGLGELTFLEQIFIEENQLNGTIHPSIINHPCLKVLVIRSNNLSGHLPWKLNKDSMLEQLTLANNKLTGTIPCDIGSLSNLKILSLSRNFMEGTIPSEIGYLIELTTLSLHNTRLSGVVPSEIGNMKALETVNLYSNSFTGTIPETLCNLALKTLTADCSMSCQCCTSCSKT